MRLAVLASSVLTALALVPVASAQPAEPPPPQRGCNAVLVAVGAVDVSLLGQVNVHTPGTELEVNLGGLAGAIVCPILGGGLGRP